MIHQKIKKTTSDASSKTKTINDKSFQKKHQWWIIEKKTLQWSCPCKYLYFLDDELVEPARVDLVVLEVIRLQQFDEILDRRAEVSSNRQLLQRDHHVP